MRLKKIENRILEINNILSDPVRKAQISVGIPTELYNDRLEQANRPLHEEKAQLETKRNFIIESRGTGFASKIIWNILVPIFVTVVTVYILKRYGLS